MMSNRLYYMLFFTSRCLELQQMDHRFKVDDKDFNLEKKEKILFLSRRL